ncbi:MAG: undecaprenyl-diphosphate phosphatase [Pseudomonadota bacterium]
MTLFQLVVLAIVQGITEFLPISSSAHLILPHKVMGWPDQGLLIDVAVHVGTLFAVMLFFWREIGWMILGGLRLLTGKMTPGGNMAILVVVGSLPVIFVGYLVNEFVAEDALRTIEIIAWTTIIFGILLGVVDKMSLSVRRIEHLKISDALIIGFAQVFALLPGTSRSGVTMTAGRLLGLERLEAARFSLLLSIPAILGPGVLKGYELYESRNLQLGIDAGIAVALSFVFALIALVGMMRWLRHASFTPFVIYRLILGIVLLIIVYGQ